MDSLKRHEGYLLIDNRNAPPVPEEVIRAVGKPVLGTGVRGVLEAAILTCAHCHRQMLKNLDRTRERGFCPKCNHYVCDGCEFLRVKTGECRNMNAIIDRLQEQAAKNLNLAQV